MGDTVESLKQQLVKTTKQYEGKLAALKAISDTLRGENEKLLAALQEAQEPRGDAGEVLDWLWTAAAGAYMICMTWRSPHLPSRLGRERLMVASWWLQYQLVALAFSRGRA